MSARTIAAEKRQHIVETAYRLFKRYGFHATGIDRIIAEAGVAKMTVYRHFPSKDGLIVAVLDWRTERFEEELDRMVEAAPNAKEKIGAIFDWHERWFAQRDFRGCPFQHAIAEFGDRNHPVFKAAARQKTRLKQRMRGILAASMPSAEAKRAAAALFMLIEGSTLLAEMGQGAVAIRNARLAAASLLAAPREPH